jgi:ubiquinol-cytochrome c reductase cytochrome c1 subunit
VEQGWPVQAGARARDHVALIEKATTTMKKLIAILALALAPVLSHAAGAGYPLDAAPPRATDLAGLQNGAKLFMNYCLNCHSANLKRYNKLQDLGLTEEQIRNNLLFSAEKTGDMMKVAMTAKDGKDWFGKAPPDLSVITRGKSSVYPAYKGTDYIYTYLRTYYRDAASPHGWNNLVYPNAAMPHVMWDRQPARELTTTLVHQVTDDKGVKSWEKVVTKYDTQGQKTEVKEPLKDFHGHSSSVSTWAGGDGDALAAYDRDLADLVGFLEWMSDPSAAKRRSMGVWVLMFIGFFGIMAWWLNSVYWRKIK